MTQRLVTLLSGGIESLVVAALAAEKFPEARRHALFVDYGQVPVEHEREASRKIARTYGMNLEEVSMSLPFLSGYDLMSPGIMFSHTLEKELGAGESVPRGDPERSHVIPMRNLIFLSIAGSYATSIGANELWVGFDYHPQLPSATADKSPEFVHAVQQAFRIAKEGKTVTIVTPLQGNSKVDTILAGEKLEVDWGISWSCYNALDYACGVCAQCLTRTEAFAAVAMKCIYDGIDYHSRDFIRDQMGR